MAARSIPKCEQKNKYWNSNLHLVCSLGKCKAKISLKTVWPIQIDQVGKVFKLNAATSDEILTDIRNYVQIEHKCGKCLPSKDTDGFCDHTRHQSICMQDVPQTLQVRFWPNIF